MKILAFSDLHGSRSHAAALVKASEQADLVIAAGDFCNMRQGLGEAIGLLSGIAAPMIAVPGNAESASELSAVAPKGMTVLHGTGCVVQGLRLFGLGYAVPETPFGAWSCDLSEADAAALLAPCTEADILVVHAPPKGIADRTSSGMSVGSTAIREAITRIRPRLTLCGHIHDSWGESGRIGDSDVVNLGPEGRWFEVAP